MDIHSSQPDDLKKFEARLANWKPAPEGLDPEAMLFAAGRASVRTRARFAWPIVSGCLALTVMALSARLSAERSERQALVREILQASLEGTLASASVPDKQVLISLEADSYLVLRQKWEQQGEETVWPKEHDQVPKEPGIPETPVLRAWQPGGPFEPS
jgi:hypothetical protein